MTRLPHVLRKSTSILLHLVGRKGNKCSFACDMKTISKRKNHRLFEFMLQRYDPFLDLSYCSTSTDKQFIHQGSGSGTIKPYRTFYKGGVRYFEKIFFNDALELKSISEFYDNSCELACQHRIQIPSLLQTIKGSKLTVLLYEYRDIVPLAIGSRYQALKKGTLALAQNKPQNRPASTIRLNLVVDGEKHLLNKGVFTEEEIIDIKQIIHSLPVCFQHLDLSTNNVYADHFIMDWDHSGHYHLGPDLGMLLFHYFYFYKTEFLATYKEEIESYHRHLDQEVDLNHFTVALLYYFAVYFKGYFRDYEDPVIFPELVQECKTLLLTTAVESKEMVLVSSAGH